MAKLFNILRLIRHCFKARPLGSAEAALLTIFPPEGKLKSMLMDPSLHAALHQELANICDLAKRKAVIKALHIYTKHIFSTRGRQATLYRLALRMLQDLFIKTVQDEVSALNPSSEAEKNAIYQNILQPAQEADILNGDEPFERRLQLRAAITLIIMKMNQSLLIESNHSLVRDTTHDVHVEQTVH